MPTQQPATERIHFILYQEADWGAVPEVEVLAIRRVANDPSGVGIKCCVVFHAAIIHPHNPTVAGVKASVSDMLGVRAGVKTLSRRKLLKMLEELHADESARDQLLLAGEIVGMSPKSQRLPLRPARYSL